MRCCAWSLRAVPVSFSFALLLMFSGFSVWRTDAVRSAGYLCQLTVAEYSTSDGNQTSSPSSPSSSTGQQYKGGAVVIQPQYRLGVFGFLGGDALRTRAGAGAGGEDGGGKGGTSGNWGALDIRLALEWVRDNAKQFGGDPNKVMLAGQSVRILPYVWSSARVSFLCAESPCLYRRILGSRQARLSFLTFILNA